MIIWAYWLGFIYFSINLDLDELNLKKKLAYLNVYKSQFKQLYVNIPTQTGAGEPVVPYFTELLCLLALYHLQWSFIVLHGRRLLVILYDLFKSYGSSLVLFVLSWFMLCSCTLLAYQSIGFINNLLPLYD